MISIIIESAVSESDYASLARCTQYAHFTPEFIIRAIWAGLLRLGWRGGRILEPGIGTGLFAALMPEAYRNNAHVTGVELDPVTARIVRLLQPKTRIIEGISRVPSLRRFTISPSAIRPSPIGLSALTGTIGRWVCGCTTILSPVRSTS